MLQRIVATLMILGFMGTIAGCNTVAGAGKDISRGGEAVQNTAKDVQRKI